MEEYTVIKTFPHPVGPIWIWIRTDRMHLLKNPGP